MYLAIFVCVGWVFSLCLHEFCHSLVAYWGGDHSVKDKGYLTFNILKYTDPTVSLVMPLVILALGGIPLPGGAVYINHRNLRSKWWESAVSLAGPYGSALAGIIFALPFLLDVHLPGPSWLPEALATLVLLQVFVVLFNLLPVPGLDGFGVIDPWLPDGLRRSARQVGNYGFWILIAVIFFVPQANNAFWGLTFYLGGLFGVPAGLMDSGFNAFMAQRGWVAIGIVIMMVLANRHRAAEPSAADWFKVAKENFAKNQTEQALSAVETALQKQPNFPEAWHLRGLCLGVLQRNAEAMQNFDQALALKPDYADCWYNKACCYALQGQPEPALESLQRAMQLNPTEQLKEHARQDVGFSLLRDDPRFQNLIAAEPTQA